MFVRKLADYLQWQRGTRIGLFGLSYPNNFCVFERESHGKLRTGHELIGSIDFLRFQQQGQRVLPAGGLEWCLWGFQEGYGETAQEAFWEGVRICERIGGIDQEIGFKTLWVLEIKWPRGNAKDGDNEMVSFWVFELVFHWWLYFDMGLLYCLASWKCYAYWLLHLYGPFCYTPE